MTILPPPPPDLLQNASLFLDFDGTLVELAESPSAVVVDRALTDLMAALDRALGGRLAIISGRSVEHIRAYFADLAIPVGGSHGVELSWPDGRRAAPARPAALTDLADRVARFADAHPGVLIENKPFGFAIHYRQAPEAEAASHALAEALARDGDLHLQPGKMMVEVRVPGADKGTAIEALMQDPKLAAGRPVFVGDDLTDEPGFAAVARLGGIGILVGPERPTAATHGLAGVAETLAWLTGAIGVTG